MLRIKISRNQILVLLGSTLVFAIALIVILQVIWGGVRQPIAFNHKIHAENDLECSGKPTLETCLNCHEEPLGESKAEEKLIEYIKSGEEIGWERLYQVPEDVYFSHRMHVVLGNIECSTCHGDIGESSRPPSKPLKITMKKCMKCHEEKEADNDCMACHR
jgi:hypothetical protein